MPQSIIAAMEAVRVAAEMAVAQVLVANHI